MNDKVRKTLPLVGALALTASALLAGTGVAFAGKALPTAVPSPGVCQDLGTDTQYRVTYDLSANKGKWVNVNAVLTVGGTDYQAFPATNTRWDKNVFLQTEATIAGDPQPATMTLFLNDNKGDALAAVTQDFCN